MEKLLLRMGLANSKYIEMFTLLKCYIRGYRRG